MVPISHSPSECREALQACITPICIDLETTGKERTAQIVSAGLLIENKIFILFVRSRHASITNIHIDQFYWALEPLASPSLVTVYHNAPFDLGHLHRVGIKVGGTIHCTLQMLRLIDQDRGGDGASVKVRRIDRRAPPGAKRFTNYRLKDCVPMLTGVGMIDFPGSMAALPYQEHTTYLSSDLLGTKALYDHLTGRLRAHPELQGYYDRLCAPLTPALVAMTEYGICTDTNFIRSECERLDRFAEALLVRHCEIYGVEIGTTADVARWLWGTLKLRPGRYVRQGDRWVPSLDHDQLVALLVLHNGDTRICDSLSLIDSLRRAKGLRSQLGSLRKHIERDGKIRVSLVDRQATGRISASKPNLQAIARTQEIPGATAVLETFRPRNALIASPGFTLVALDLAQADIRVLANAAASHKLAQLDHLDALRRRRCTNLAADPEWRRLHALIDPLKNLQYPERDTEDPEPPLFYPALGSGLARVFNEGAVDFYTATATAMLGAPPEDKRERHRWRDHCKQTILGIINGMGPTRLAKRLGCNKVTAKFYLDKFETAYPNDAAYRRMMVEQIAITGRIETFAGRDRTDTAHRWLVTLPRVEILVSFKGPPANRYWLDVSPLEPHRHTLTVYIHRAWDAMPGAHAGTLIYDAAQGCTTRRNYHLYDTTFLQFRLPLRNFGWRSIRRVRPGHGSANWGEEVKYRGLDAVTRALFNALAQGGTADITKIMILYIGPTLSRFNAQLLLQIHDELLFEVPSERVQAFVDTVVPELTQVVPEFAVPIILEAKIGTRFGEMEPLTTSK